MSVLNDTSDDLRVSPPFRLDLTISALRRLPTNLVDVYTADGRYLRAFGDARNAVIVSVRQSQPDRLTVSLHGPAHDVPSTLATVGRILGVDRDLTEFHLAASAITWLAPLTRRTRGLKPPRYPTLFEACVNAVLFQQISLHAASSIMSRFVLALGVSVEHEGVPLVAFPTAQRFLDAGDAEIRGLGVSAAKLATLRRLARAIIDRELVESELGGRSSAEAAKLLCAVKGVGPWTAAVILLRGLGRLDVFPRNDSGVAANLALVAGEPLPADAVAASLGSQRGMLYFNLLLARLEARGEIGLASQAPT